MRYSWIVLVLTLVASAYAATISTTTIVPSLQDTDRIPIGRPGGTTAYTTTPVQITQGFRTYTTSVHNRWVSSVVLTSYSTHIRNYSNPHAVSAAQIGLPNYNGSAGFNNISTNAIYIRQGDNAQALELFEAAANGNSTLTIAVQSQMSSSRSVVIGNHGMYVDGVQVLTW
jgi:hypothetical protein